MSHSEHLDAEAVYRLLDGHLPAAIERTAEAHLCRCAACRGLREECAATLSALRWYAAAPPAPPAGYWATFWTGLSIPGIRVDREPAPARLAAARRFAPLALAASLATLLALGAGVWWSRSGGPPGVDAPFVATISAGLPTGPAGGPSGDAGWEDDWAFFERVSYAIGSVDPLSKGVALAGLAEASRAAVAEPLDEIPVGP